MREAITVSLESKVIQDIDRSKGKNEPRSRFVEDIIIEFLKKKRQSLKIQHEERLSAHLKLRKERGSR